MYDDRAALFVALVPGDDRFMSFHLVETDGATYSRGRAVIATLSALDRTRFLGRFLTALRMSWLMDGLYSVVARNRGILGHLVVDRDGPTRFRD